MKKQIQQVTDFHQSIGEKVAESPDLLQLNHEADRGLASGLRELIATATANDKSLSHLNRRALMAIEELAEWIEAHLEGDRVAAADAIGDRLYVLLGDAVATGLPVVEIFDEVHQSNMTKTRQKQSTGKGVKGKDFSRPIFKVSLNPNRRSNQFRINQNL